MRSARGPRINAYALTAFRKQTGQTQTQLAEAANLSPSHVSRLESGKRKWPSLRITEALAGALGVPVSALLASDQWGGH